MHPESETGTREGDRLARLVAAVGELLGTRVDDPQSTIGDLGVGSQHIVELLIACEDIYDRSVDGDALDLGYESSIMSLHQQLLSRAAP